MDTEPMLDEKSIAALAREVSTAKHFGLIVVAIKIGSLFLAYSLWRKIRRDRQEYLKQKAEQGGIISDKIDANT